jgi:hypothetical protein
MMEIDNNLDSQFIRSHYVHAEDSEDREFGAGSVGLLVPARIIMIMAREWKKEQGGGKSSENFALLV